MKVLVIGAALSGTEVSKLLAKKGYEVYLTDAKDIANKEELEKYKEEKKKRINFKVIKNNSSIVELEQNIKNFLANIY